MQSQLATLPGNSPKLVQLVKAVSSRPALSLLRNFTSAATNCTHILDNHAHISDNTTKCCSGQQQRQYCTDLPSIACKDLNKKLHGDFSCNFAKHVLQEGLKTPQRNTVCSPISTDALLNMLVPGSKGQTLDQFLDVLSLKREEKVDKSASKLLDVLRPFKGRDGPKITVSNGVWVDKQYPLTRSYEELLRNVHKAEVQTVDFMCTADEVVEEVNQWAKSKTKGMIKNILPETSYYNDTVMVLVNILHFKLETSEETFNPTEARHSFYYSGSYGGCEVLRVPYREAKTVTGEDDRSFSMYIFVPPKKDGLLKCVDEMKLDAKTFKREFKRQDEQISEIYVPKFNLESQLPLLTVMKQLGLTLPFKANQSELMRLVDSPAADLLYVTDVTQKSRIETNEEGTTVAVSTYATLCGPAHNPAAPSKLKFSADNPFLFMIKEDSSGAVVSVGSMLSSSLLN